jgi:hypothetical protein
MSGTKNLGLVQAIWISSTPPTNIKMLWFDTALGIHKSYNTTTSAWVAFVVNLATAPLFRNGSSIELHYDTNQFELVGGAITIKTNVLASVTPPFPISDITGLETALALKVDIVTGKSLILDTEIIRLATVVNYTHPTTHPASIIIQDSTNRFVTDAEKSTWNSKEDALGYVPYDSANPAGYITAAYFTLSPIVTIFKLTLPSQSTVAARCAAAISGVDYPTGWTLSADSNPNDLLITHGLGKSLYDVQVASIVGVTKRRMIYPASYVGLFEVSSNQIRIEGLATIATQIGINIILS